VTSNYRYDLAPYTWELVQGLKEGPRDLHPAADADQMRRRAAEGALSLGRSLVPRGRAGHIDIQFMNAGGVLFGVKDYVPALQGYMNRYGGAELLPQPHRHRRAGEKGLVRGEGSREGAAEVEVEFDMIHVCPPQVAPDFIRVSPLADAAGWVDVDQATLRHKTYENIWSLGDVMNAPNAKTAAAARMQAPIVAENVATTSTAARPRRIYNGYGSCPLTVERGKIVLAEFGYGGTLLPSFPKWLIDGTKPTRAAWFLKETVLPPIYWKAMLRGREWMARKGPAKKNRRARRKPRRPKTRGPRPTFLRGRAPPTPPAETPHRAANRKDDRR
jgi:sulfide:quinone oxidoreductase